jgi:hypothetical protein
VNDVIEVSYTGDVLAHRRCARAWAYEKYAGFYPYEQVQAMEGRLIHHAMEWMTRRYRETRRHVTLQELDEQLTRYFRVLWARGLRTAFTSKQETLDRVKRNVFPSGRIHKTIKAAIEGAQHSEYELRAVRKLVKGDFAGKSRLLLTGVLDLVVQQQDPLVYERVWQWKDRPKLEGRVAVETLPAKQGDLEIWDYKATRSETIYKPDYVRQLLTYATLYRERTGVLPVRCVLFFVNDVDRPEDQLLAIPIDVTIVETALAWTLMQVQDLRKTAIKFEKDPTSVHGMTVDVEVAQQCTACGFRFDCVDYTSYLKRPNHPDIRLDNVRKN